MTKPSCLDSLRINTRGNRYPLDTRDRIVRLTGG